MNTIKIIEELRKQYPGKAIILDPTDNPSEIICELEPTSEHPEKSVALAIVGKSVPHFHKMTTEIYVSVKGTLTVYKNGERFIVNEGEQITIEPTVIHHVEGDEAWFLTYSQPGWTFEDHIMIK